jgi:hypothetical protein
MNAIDVLGKVAEGIMGGQQEIRQQRATDTQQETQKLQQKALEYEMVEKEKERQVLDSYVPLSSVWPDWRDNPSTMKMFGNVLGKTGMADQVIKQKDDVYITNRALKNWQGILKNNFEMADILSKAKLRDLDTKFNDLALIASTGQKPDGTKVKEEEMGEINKQIDNIKKYKTMIFSASKESQLKLEELKQQHRLELSKSWEFAGKQNGMPIERNKITGEYRDQNGNSIIPGKGFESTQELMRSSTSTVIHNPAPFVDKEKEEYSTMSDAEKKKYGVSSLSDYRKWKANLKDKKKEEANIMD